MAIFTIYFSYLMVHRDGLQLLYMFGLVEVIFFGFIAAGLTITAVGIQIQDIQDTHLHKE